MASRDRRRRSLARVVATAAVAGVCAYFTHHSLEGANGWKAREARIAERDALAERLAGLTAQREVMRRRAALMDGSIIERDVLDERARELLGMAHADEIVVILPL